MNALGPQMTLYDIYTKSEDNSARFSLGCSGSNMLIVIGLNPSSATNLFSDPTIRQTKLIVDHAGCDGFIMINLYPLISTDPRLLPINPDPDLIARNLSEIHSIANPHCFEKEKALRVWAAWGNLIDKRRYLKDCLRLIASSTILSRSTWIKYGELTKRGHPGHPSRKSSKLRFTEFGLDDYLAKV
jgi:hypothetical protein